MTYSSAKLVRTGVAGVRTELLKDERSQSMGQLLQTIVRTYRQTLEKQTKEEGWISHKARVEAAQKLARDSAKRVQGLRENITVYAQNVQARQQSLENMRRQLEGSLTQLDWAAAQATAQHLAQLPVAERSRYAQNAAATGNVQDAVAIAMVPGMRDLGVDTLRRMADPRGYQELQAMRTALSNLTQAADSALIGFDHLSKDQDPVRVPLDHGMALSVLSADVAECLLPQAPPEPPPADVPPQEAA